MSTGLSVVNLANPYLNVLRGVAPTLPGGEWVQLHIGDPGASGIANLSAVTTRVQATHNVPSGGTMSLLSVSASWTMTATETISHASVHSASSGGNFLYSWQLTIPRSVGNLDLLTLTTLLLSWGPLAA